MRNIMVDLETMSTEPNAAIISIGAVKFGATGLGQTFYRVVEFESSVNNGLSVNPSTVMWWMKQSDEARAQFNTDDATHIIRALYDFSRFVGDEVAQKEVKIWGNGSDFDNVILANAYRTLKMNAPWRYYNNRCYRTVKSLFSDVPIDRKGVYLSLIHI